MPRLTKPGKLALPNVSFWHGASVLGGQVFLVRRRGEAGAVARELTEIGRGVHGFWMDSSRISYDECITDTGGVMLRGARGLAAIWPAVSRSRR